MGFCVCVVFSEAKSMSKQEMADDVPMRDASNLSVELDNHRKKINETEEELSEVKQNLKKVNTKLDKLDQDLNKVNSKLDKLEGKEGAGTLSDVEQKHLERLREDKRQLQTEKLFLLDKEKALRKNEEELRRAPTSSTPYSSAASAHPAWATAILTAHNLSMAELPKSCPCLQRPLAGGDKAQAPKLVGRGGEISGGLGHGVAACRGSGTLLTGSSAGS